MDMSGFNAIWEEINTESMENISREEFRSFHDNAERNFYLSLGTYRILTLKYSY